MELWMILARTVFTYFVVFLVMRIMGKREIGKLSVFDLVISIMIAEIAVIMIEDVKKPIVNGLLPIAVLVIIQLTIAFFSLKSRRVRSLFDGQPSVVIQNGKLQEDEMRKLKYNIDDLMLQLREKEITNIEDVEFAVLETTGKLSVINKDHFATKPQTNKQDAPFRYEGLPLPLIMDGQVQDQYLDKIGKTRFWLKNQIQAQGVHDFKDVFLCTVDHKGQIYIDKKMKS